MAHVPCIEEQPSTNLSHERELSERLQRTIAELQTESQLRQVAELALQRTQAELAAAQHVFCALTASLPQLLWTCSSSGFADYFSPQWEHYTGKPQAELIGLGWLELIHSDDRDHIVEIWSSTLLSYTEHLLLFRLLRHDGMYRWFETRAMPYLNEQGQVEKWYGTTTDIHDAYMAREAQQQNAATRYTQAGHDKPARPRPELAQGTPAAPAALTPSEGEFRTLADHALVGIFRSHRDGQIFYLNPTMARILGVASHTDMKALNAFSFYKNPQDRTRLVEQLSRSGRVQDYELTVLTPAGDVRQILTSIALEEVTIAGTAIDITERTSTEEQLRRQARHLQALAHVSQALAEARLDEQATLDRVARAIAEAIGDNCVIRLLSDEQTYTQPMAIYDVDPAALEASRAVLSKISQRVEDEPVTQRVIQTAQAIVIPVLDKQRLHEATAEETWPMLERFNWHSLICAPMRAPGQVFGVVSVTRHQADSLSFDLDDLSLVQNLADRAALAISNARLYQQVQNELSERVRAEEAVRRLNAELEQRVLDRTAELAQANAVLQIEITERAQLEQRTRQHAARAQALASLSRMLAAHSLEYQPLFDTIAQRIALHIGDACIVTKLSDDRQKLEIVAMSHCKAERLPFIRDLVSSTSYYVDMGGIAGQVAQTGQAMLAPRLSSRQLNPAYEAYTDRFNACSVLVVPLQARGRILGTLGVMREVPGPPYTPNDQAFLQDLADHASLEIENTRLFVEVHQARKEAEQANKAKSEFLSSMSHELRTPLNAVIGFTGTLLMQLPGPLNTAQEKQLKTIQASARHLLSLINDLLDLARIESGKIELHLERLNCQEIIEEVASSMRSLSDQKGLRLSIAHPSEPIELITDRRALYQILTNLLSNAIKFTDQGEVQIELTQNVAPEQRATLISVRDTGVGIAADDQARLFQEFGRVGSANVRQREGTGLGLQLARRLAQLLGGDITLSSQLGQGSTFTLTISEA